MFLLGEQQAQSELESLCSEVELHVDLSTWERISQFNHALSAMGGGAGEHERHPASMQRLRY